jgi:hypothetical protein
MLSTPQAPHESRIFHIGTPAKVSLRDTHTHTQRPTHRVRKDSRDEIFTTVLLPRDTHIKALNNYFYFYFFVVKIRRKVPHENIHGKTSVLENFQKTN